MGDIVLPNELLVSILENVHDDDNDCMTSLRQCSYTNRSLRVKSQKLLFKAFNFYEYDSTYHSLVYAWRSPSRWRRFFDLMEILPHVVDYVKVVRISSNGLFMYKAEKYIPAILPRFKKLTEFSILQEDDHARWDTIPEMVQNTILEVLQSPSLSHISLHIYSIPHIHIHKFSPSLKSLTISSVYLDDIDLAHFNSRSIGTAQSKSFDDTENSQIMLKELSVEYLQENSATLLWLSLPISPFNFSQLSSLTLRLASGYSDIVDLGYVDMLFRVVSDSVENLTLALNTNHIQHHMKPHKPYHIGPPSLAVFSRLRCLTLEVPAPYIDGERHPNAIPWITRLLETSSKLGLKTIRFNFDFEDVQEKHLAEIKWDGIRKILLEDFPERPVIEFRICDLLSTRLREILLASKGMNELTGGNIIFAYRRRTLAC